MSPKLTPKHFVAAMKCYIQRHEKGHNDVGFSAHTKECEDVGMLLPLGLDEKYAKVADKPLESWIQDITAWAYKIDVGLGIKVDLALKEELKCASKLEK